MAVLRRIGVLSVAKVTAVIFAIVGLVLAVPFGLVVMARGGAGSFSLLWSVAVPILYAAGGFVGGALYAWLYNVVAGWIGGIELDLES